MLANPCTTFSDTAVALPVVRIIELLAIVDHGGRLRRGLLTLDLFASLLDNFLLLRDIYLEFTAANGRADQYMNIGRKSETSSPPGPGRTWPWRTVSSSRSACSVSIATRYLAASSSPASGLILSPKSNQ